MNKTFLVIFGLLGAALLPACGSSGSSSSSCTPPSSTNSTPACDTCVQSSCSSQYSEVCAANCQTNASSSACMKANGDVVDCILQNCSAQCDLNEETAGTGTGTGGATSSAGGASSSVGGSSAAGASSIGTGGSTAGEEHSYCYQMAEGTCTVTVAPAGYKATFDMACVSGGGTAPDSCPTAGLLGCCTIGGGVEVCSYSSALTQADCTAEGGTWSATP